MAYTVCYTSDDMKFWIIYNIITKALSYNTRVLIFSCYLTHSTHFRSICAMNEYTEYMIVHKPVRNNKITIQFEDMRREYVKNNS